MGYLLLCFTLAAGVVKGLCGKKVSSEVPGLKGSLYVTMIRFIFCIAIGFVIVAAGGISALGVSMTTILISVLAGISSALFVTVWLFCVRNGAYVMVDIFLMLGVGITVVLCRIFFGEAVETTQIIGYLLLVVAAVLMSSYSASIKGSFTLKTFTLLAVCGIANALSDFSLKMFVHCVPGGDIAVFNFYTYVFAALTIFIVYKFVSGFNTTTDGGISSKIILIVAIMAVCLFAYSFFKTKAALYMQSAILYPLCSGAALILSVIMSSVFFKERVTFKCFCGVVVALTSIVIMNL